MQKGSLFAPQHINSAAGDCNDTTSYLRQVLSDSRLSLGNNHCRSGSLTVFKNILATQFQTSATSKPGRPRTTTSAHLKKADSFITEFRLLSGHFLQTRSNLRRPGDREQRHIPNGHHYRAHIILPV